MKLIMDLKHSRQSDDYPNHNNATLSPVSSFSTPSPSPSPLFASWVVIEKHLLLIQMMIHQIAQVEKFDP